MTGDSRFRYHGVPKIIRTDREPWNNFSDDELSAVLRSGLQWGATGRSEKELGYNTEDRVTFEKVCDRHFWQPFANYIRNARINLNIRQVNLPELSQLRT